LNGQTNGKGGIPYMDGVWELLEEDSSFTKGQVCNEDKKSPDTESDISLTETSEEEMH